MGLADVARRLLGEAVGAADDILFPWSCQVCGDAARDRPFCHGCARGLRESMGRACPRCALPVGPYAANDGACGACRGHSLGFDRALAVGAYREPIRSLCLKLKHSSGAWLAHWLGQLLAEARAAEFGGLAAESPVIVPIPLHWTRRLARGYNQAEALALGLSRALGWPMRRSLRRGRGSPRLAGLSRTGRAAIMKGAFRVGRRAGISGRTVILVDDVLTTGATCGAAARALKDAGASRVVVAVIGRTEPGRY